MFKRRTIQRYNEWQASRLWQVLNNTASKHFHTYRITTCVLYCCRSAYSLQSRHGIVFSKFTKIAVKSSLYKAPLIKLTEQLLYLTHTITCLDFWWGNLKLQQETRRCEQVSEWNDYDRDNDNWILTTVSSVNKKVTSVPWLCKVSCA